MAINLQKGQKIDLTKGHAEIKHLLIGLGWNVGQDADLDTAAFLLRANGKAGGDEDFIFYGNLTHKSGSVRHMGDNLQGTSSGDAEQIQVDIARIPADVERIAFTVTIYDAENNGQNFGRVRGAYIRVVDADTQRELLRYDLGQEFSNETAVVAGELYRYKGEWKFNAIGSGYQGGLAALCKSFGIEVAAPPQPTASPPSPPPTLNQQSNNPPPQKVELRKGQKVSLAKTSGEISINLNWQQPKGGFFFSNTIDLDLACLFEMRDGSKGCVQALGNSFGNLQSFPYIALDGDDRTGSSANGETMRINGKRVSEIQRVLVFTFIYDGAADWAEAKGVVTVKCPGSPDVVVRMDEYGSRKSHCAIAMLENTGRDTFSVEKLVRFFNGHRELDRAFHWGLRWVAGSKD